MYYGQEIIDWDGGVTFGMVARLPVTRHVRLNEPDVTVTSR